MLFLSYSFLPKVPDLNLELPRILRSSEIQVCIYLLYFIIHRFISVVISNTNESLMLVSIECFASTSVSSTCRTCAYTVKASCETVVIKMYDSCRRAPAIEWTS